MLKNRRINFTLRQTINKVNTMIKNLSLTVLLLLTITLTALAQNESTSRWSHSDGSTELNLTVRNNVRFNDDYTDISNISGNGSVEVFERRNGSKRQLKISAGTNGQIIRVYSVNGETRSFDDEGKSWFAKVMAEAVSKGFDAGNRAAQIIRQRGATALVSETLLLTGDYTKRVYLEAAIKSGDLSADVLQDVFKQAESDISSDYEKAMLLISSAKTSLTKRKTLDAYFAAANTIKSDYERGRVLKTVLEAYPTNKDVLMMTLASAEKIKSDYEKANVLIQVGRDKAQDEGIRKALLNAVKTITSDYERGRVLNSVYLNETK